MSAKTDARKDFSPVFLPVHPGNPYFTRVSGVLFFLHLCKGLQKDGCFSLFLARKKCSFGRVRIKKSLENPVFSRLLWRRGWDSNPCALARKLISSQPRYDRFDTSPYILKRLSLRARMQEKRARNYEIVFIRFFRSPYIIRVCAITKPTLSFILSSQPRYDRFDTSP